MKTTKLSKCATIVLMILLISSSGAGMTAGWAQARPSAAEKAELAAIPGGYLEKALAGEYAGTTIVLDGPFTDADEDKLRQSYRAFEEGTGITISYVGSREFESTIEARVDAGNAPDVAVFPQPTLLATFARQGKIVDPGTFIPLEWLQQQYHQSWLDMAMMEGPGGSSMMGGLWYLFNTKSLVWYPKDDWDAAGYGIPTTWDEMLALSDQIVADGDTPWCVGIESGAATGWPATDWLEDIMLRTTSLGNYDRWVSGQLKFTSTEVRSAAETLGALWFKDGYVFGGRNAIVSTFFGDAPAPMFEQPPKCWLHRQGNFITGFFAEGAEFEVDYDLFYLPPIDSAYGKPFLVAGDIMGMFNDRPEVRALMEYFTIPESAFGWRDAGGALAAHKTATPDMYAMPIERRIATLVQEATSFRWDASDLMPAEVGTGSFWKGMTDWVSGAAELDTVLSEIDASWPPPSAWHVAVGGSDVDGDGSVAAPFATIQHGIDMANHGDTVLVHPGTYQENINFAGKNITVGSLFITSGDKNYITGTVIDGSRNGHVVTFESGEGNTAQLSGFTLTNGYAHGDPGTAAAGGGGIRCSYSSPSLAHLRVTDNEALAWGGGLFFDHCSPTLRELVVTNNRAGDDGGGILYAYSHADLENIVLSSNSSRNGGAGIFFYWTDGFLRNALIADNVDTAQQQNRGGGGAMFDGGSPIFVNVTVVGNRTTGGGGGLNVSYMSQPMLVNSIVWGNTPEQVYFDPNWGGQAITIEYSDIQGGEAGIVTNGRGPVNWGAGNLDADPAFVGAGLGDYHLGDSSPCIGAGKAAGAPGTDIEGNPRPRPAGSNPDMGAYENPHGPRPVFMVYLPTIPHTVDLLDQVRAAGRLVVATDPNYAPWSFLNDQGELDGFDADVAKQVAGRLGVQLEFVTPDWDMITAGNWGGRWDISIGSMNPTEPRAEVLWFTDPYYYTPAAFAVHKDNTSITKVEDLGGKKVGVGTATPYEDYLNGTLAIMGGVIAYDPPAGVIITPYSTDAEAIQDLALGDGTRLDAVMSAQPTIQQAIDSGVPLKYVGTPAFYQPAVIALDKARGPSHEMIAALNYVLADMRNDGTLSEISLRWTGIDLTYPSPRNVALKITGKVGTEIGWTEEEVRAMEAIEVQYTEKSGETRTYTGVLISKLLAMAFPAADATTVVFVADDGYTAEAPLADVLACAECIVAFREQGGFRTVLPGFAGALQVQGVKEMQVK